MAARRGKPDPWGDVQRDVSSGSLASVYVLLGPERLLVRRAYDLLYAAGVGGGPRGFNEQVFQGETATGASIVGACNTLPMMASRRVVVVRAVEKLKKADQDELAAYCANASPTTLLLLLTSAAATKSESRKKTKFDGRTKLVKAIKKHGRHCEFKKIYGRSLQGWIEAEAKSLGKRLPARAGTFLEGVVGNDLGALRNCLLNASLFVGEADEISLPDLERVVSGDRQEALWDLLDAVRDRSPEALQRNLVMLYRQENTPLSVLFLAKKMLKQIRSAEALRDQGMSDEEAAKKSGVGPTAFRWRGKLGRYSPADLDEAVSILVGAESDIKGGRRVDPRWTLEQALLQVVRRPARPRRA
jgi:DNA polymerase-3 subunit delta